MPLLLNIDTATEHASVCLSKGDTVLGLIESHEQKNHASFVQPAIQELVTAKGFSLKQLDAVAVTAGPGSYTGLRVGLATAKGICYALHKPLILVNTLEVMAQSVLSHLYTVKETIDANTFICPMIDARRMEVFTALYDPLLTQVQAPYALILKEDSFADLLKQHRVIFTGSGHIKWKSLLQAETAVFLPVQHNATDLAVRAHHHHTLKQFADLAYSEPLYVKEFFDPSQKR